MDSYYWMGLEICRNRLSRKKLGERSAHNGLLCEKFEGISSSSCCMSYIYVKLKALPVTSRFYSCCFFQKVQGLLQKSMLFRWNLRKKQDFRTWTISWFQGLKDFLPSRNSFVVNLMLSTQEHCALIRKNVDYISSFNTKKYFYVHLQPTWTQT